MAGIEENSDNEDDVGHSYVIAFGKRRAIQSMIYDATLTYLECRLRIQQLHHTTDVDVHSGAAHNMLGGDSEYKRWRVIYLPPMIRL